VPELDERRVRRSRADPALDGRHAAVLLLRAPPELLAHHDRLVEPLLPAKGYSVFYIKAPGFGETDVAYLVRTPNGMDNRLINLYDITDAWMLTALDDFDYRRAPVEVLKKAVNDALKTHPLPNPTSYML
jgi:hypothetical protein